MARNNTTILDPRALKYLLEAPTIYGVANYQPLKRVNLPDITAEIEGHLWDNLLDPYAADAAKDVRAWAVEGVSAIFMLNGKEVEVIEHKGVNPTFSKWKFRTPEAANKFGEMMLPFSTVIGLL